MRLVIPDEDAMPYTAFEARNGRTCGLNRKGNWVLLRPDYFTKKGR